CQVAARLGEAGDKAEPDRVLGRDEDNGDRRGCRLGGQRRRTICGSYHRDPTGHQVAGHRREPISLVLGKAIEDHHGLAFDIAGILQALAKPAQTVRERVRGSGMKKPDDRHRRLLRPRRERPRGGSAGKQSGERAPPHSITSSARASKVGGTVSPSAFAVLRLSTKSYLSGACTGRAAGLSPLRM